jgi:serine-type D-Ala-D-Ala carboxypeptidase
MAASDHFDALREVCEVAVSAGVVPGAVVLCAEGETTRFHQAFGARQLEPAWAPTAPDTIYDVASLTKAVVTSVLAMRAVAVGDLALDEPVARHHPQFRGPGKDAVTIRHLLCHASGLPAHRPFYAPFIGEGQPSGASAEAGDVRARREAIIGAVASEPLERPPGQRSVYSDLGFILLGDLLERLAGDRLDVMTDRWLVRRLGLGATTFVPLDGTGGLKPLQSAVAPTERCAARGTLISGEVHDLNAYAMGGVAGHAGLFSSAADLGRIAAALVASWHGDVADPLVPQEVIRTFWQPAGIAGSTWRLGWDGPAEEGSQAGTRLSRRAVGHLGFTGCSLWIDPPRRLWIVVLTNRVHPLVRDDPRFKVFRPAVHDAAMLGLDG